jgi:hypothetical protein
VDVGGSAISADGRATADACLASGITLVCAIASSAFVLWPDHVGELLSDVGAEALVPLGLVFSVVLGPVAAGLAGIASCVALWRDRDALPASARRLYLLTIVVAPLVLVLLLTVGARTVGSMAD